MIPVCIACCAMIVVAMSLGLGASYAQAITAGSTWGVFLTLLIIADRLLRKVE